VPGVEAAVLGGTVWIVRRSEVKTMSNNVKEQNGKSLQLWYDRPAGEWTEALPIGNGRLGAMVFGGVENDTLQLNEDTLYAGEPGMRSLPLSIHEHYDEVLSFIKRGKYSDAGDVIKREWLGRAQTCYQVLGDVDLCFLKGGEVEEYRRTLDISRAVGRTEYRLSGMCYSREFFASHVDDVIALRITAAQPGSVSLSIGMRSPHPTASVVATDSGLTLTGQAPGVALRRTLEEIESCERTWQFPEIWNEDGTRKLCANQLLYADDVEGRGMFFAASLSANCTGGTLTPTATTLEIEGADEVVFLIAMATSFNGVEKSPSRDGRDARALAISALAAAGSHSYDDLLGRHIKDYTRLFNRVDLDLGKPTEQSALPTDQRIARFSNGNDPSLAALYFQFSRYLMLSASRSGTQPMNLQGIWNEHTIPPWASGYTTNINAEMNYWPVELFGLSECHEPLLRMIDELAADGRTVARDMFGCRGWVAFHNTTIWRCAQPVDGVPQCSWWPMAQGWLSRHLWEHYRFTGDTVFLAERAYPVMKDAALFALDWLVEDAGGKLVTPISGSPENTFSYHDPDTGEEKAGAITSGCTMDMAILRELLSFCIDASERLGIDESLRSQFVSVRSRLLPYRVGTAGQLLEWAEEYEDVDPHHRHVSHLYGLYPGEEITHQTTPELFHAARCSLEIRGDQATGWSIGWKINLWARLLDGDHAYKLVRNLITPERTYPNMFDAHPPFQIDGNFGGAAGIVEMLLQSHRGNEKSGEILDLLPALPSAWPTGSVSGLCARGGVIVDLAWEKGALVEVGLHAIRDTLCHLRYARVQTEHSLTSGQSITLNGMLC
jgi:alpha-L-fucosidase 2